MEFVVSGVGEGSVEGQSQARLSLARSVHSNCIVPRDGEASNDDGDNAGQNASTESSRKRKRQDEALDDQTEPAKNTVCESSVFVALSSSHITS